MNFLLIGSGGREHAMAWRLRRSPSVRRIVCPNGNPGIGQEAFAPRVRLKTPQEWASYAMEQKIDLVAVGPEGPLAEGVTDACEERGIAVFGPTRAGARLESSKAFAKEVMRTANIPTARSEAFDDYDTARDYARSLGLPVVVKADGLAAGKGVTVCESEEDVTRALSENLKDARFGEASRVVVVEEFLEGEELSVLAVTDGETVEMLSPAQDHKRVFDGDRGPNTGGMGAYAPAPIGTDAALRETKERVLRPAVAELARRGIRYKGVLYAGLMITAQGAKVLEFNCRFGDPETQVVLPLLDDDFGELMMACAKGSLRTVPVKSRAAHAMCVVMASGGYPGEFASGKVIRGLGEFDGAEDCAVFHAGTSAGPRGDILSAGGRVLGLTAWGSTLEAAHTRAYEMAARISFDGCHYRRDIGYRALTRRSDA